MAWIRRTQLIWNSFVSDSGSSPESEMNRSWICSELSKSPRIDPNRFWASRIKLNGNTNGGQNRAKYDQNGPNFVGFWPNFDPNYSLTKKKTWFSKRYIWECRTCILTYSAYSPVFYVFGWRFWWVLAAIRGILGRLGSIHVIWVYLDRWIGSFFPLQYD